MALAPALVQHLGDVVRVQVQVHAVVRVVDVHDLAVAAHVDGVAREEREAVLLEAARRRAELGRVPRREARQGRLERDEGRRAAVLVELALRGEAGDGGARPRAVGDRLAGEDARPRPGERGGRGQRGGEGVAEDEEAEPGEAGVAGQRGRRAPRPEAEEVLVVVPHEQEDGDGEDGGLEEHPRDEVHAHDEEQGAGQQGVRVQGDDERVLADDHVHGRGDVVREGISMVRERRGAGDEAVVGLEAVGVHAGAP